MFLILLCYLLMASTFTLAKVAVSYMQPMYFIAFRMIIAGALLLTYLAYAKPQKIRFSWTDSKLFALIIIFHIYCAYIFEFWALQYISSSKVALLYNLSPFITALLAYLFWSDTLSLQKWFALTMGFVALIPLLSPIGTTPASTIEFLAELALLFAVGSAAYGWMVMRELTVSRGYSTAFVNGIGMLIGGAAALVTAFFLEGFSPLRWQAAPEDMLGKLLVPHYGIEITSLIMSMLMLGGLILIANIAGYNLYGYLLHRYSPTLLAFFGSITPFFVSLFGWLFLLEPLSGTFFISLGFTVVCLYLFYQDELEAIKK